MTSEGRIAALEKETCEQRETIASLVRLCMCQSGENLAHRAAVRALIISCASNELLGTALRDELAEQEAKIVCAYPSEEYLDGMQQEQKLLLLAFEEGRRRHG